jgi:hypothetical protein
LQQSGEEGGRKEFEFDDSILDDDTSSFRSKILKKKQFGTNSVQTTQYSVATTVVYTMYPAAQQLLET